jgi:NTP pyrophosphatase (non-canonical NTP hydrolase)
MRDDGPARPSDERAIFDLGFGFAHAVGEVADHLKTLLRGGDWRPEQLAAKLGALAFYWVRLCGATGVPLPMLLARNRAHIIWRRAGRAEGGPAAVAEGMTIDEYARWAAATGTTMTANPPDERTLSDLGLGLAGEAGEIADTLGKLLRGGDWQPERVAHELGDAAYYWTRLCCATGVAPSDLLARSESNIEGRSLS